MSNVLVFDETTRFLPAIEEALRRRPGEHSIESVADPALLGASLRNFQPDVIVIGASRCAESIPTIKGDCPKAGIVAFAQSPTSGAGEAVSLLKAGVDDYVDIGDAGSLEAAVREAAESARRRNSLRELERVGAQWRATFDAISSPIVVVDPSGGIIRANRAFRNLAGREWREIIGARVDAILTEDYSETDPPFPVSEPIPEPIARPRVATARIDGKWFRKTAERTYSPSGAPCGEIRFYEDITRSMNLETILRESEKRYYRFFESVSLGALYLDSECRVKDINAKACAIMGVEKFDAVSERLEDIGFGAIKEHIDSIKAAIALNPANERVYSIARMADGERIWVKATVQLIHDEAGNAVSHYFVVFDDITEQKKTKEDLLTSEIRYHQLLDAAPVGVLVVAGGEVLFCNRRTAALLRADDALRIMGKRIDELNPPGEPVTPQGKAPARTRFRRLDGTPVDVEIITTGIRYSQGEATLYIINDITERLEGERLREQNEAQLRAVFQSAPLTMMVIDGDFFVRNLNELVGGAKGARPGDRRRPCEGGILRCAHSRVGREGEEGGKRCDSCNFRAAVLSTLHTGIEVHNREIQMTVQRDGTVVKPTYLLHASRITRDGEPLCLAILNDITDLKRAQNALTHTVSALELSRERNRRHSRWIKSLYSISRAIVKCGDRDSMMATALYFLERNFRFRCACVVFPDAASRVGAVHAISRRGADINGRLGATPGASYDLDRVPPFFGAAESGAVETYALLDDAFQGPDYWVGAKTSLLREGITHFAKIPFSAEQTSRGMIFLEYDVEIRLTRDEKLFLSDLADIIGMALSNFKLYAELKDSYAKLELALKNLEKRRRLEAMGQIASGITHDINNTLVPLKLYAEALLTRETGLSEKAVKYLSLIKKSADDIEHVTSRLRGFYKGADFTELEPVDIRAVLNDVRDMTRPRWKDAANKNGLDVQFAIDAPPATPLVSANASELREALINLVFNAVDAMPAGGAISLTAENGPRHASVTVADTGTGMTPEVLERCLEPFFTTKGPRGTGLGLAEVYGSVRRFGGELSIQSAVGKGTQVKLSLPYFAESDRAAPRPAGDSGAIGPLRILLVDDDARVLEVVRETLTLDGHAVTAFSSADKALEFIASSRDSGPELIITDLGMPEMDGNAFARAAKGLLPRVPVIMMTGWGKLLARDEKSPFVDRIIGKPPDLETLHSAIADTILTKGDAQGERDEGEDSDH